MKSILNKSFLTTFLFCTILYLFAVILTNPYGNFPINDDWLFQLQVESFTKGIFIINKSIDPTFILQGLLGLVWSYFFGVSFIALRMLTIITTIFFSFSCFKLTYFLTTNKKLSCFVSLLTYFNPLVFHLSQTFMTDIYFLTFWFWSIYFYLKALKSDNTKFLLIASLLGGFSILVRQSGFVVFISYFLITLFTKKLSIKNAFINILSIVITFLIYKFWPRMGLSPIIFPNFAQIPILLTNSIPYLLIFSAPLLTPVLTNKKTILSILVFLAILTTFIVYKFDIFPIGNVLYLEGLNTKAYFKSDFDLLDNSLFKLLLSIVAGFSAWGLVQRLCFKFTTSQIFLILNALGIVASIIFTTDFYERYLLGLFILFIVIISSLPRISLTKFSIFSFILLLMTSILLQLEFMNATRAKYILAEKISMEKSISSQLYVEGTLWGKLVYAQKTQDYRGSFGKDERGVSYQCFVQEYTTDPTGWFYTFLGNLDEKITRVFVVNNPQGTRKREDIPRIKKNMDKIVYIQKVFSPQKEFFGKDFYVGAWCRN